MAGPDPQSAQATMMQHAAHADDLKLTRNQKLVLSVLQSCGSR
ncbi:hypothetical protein [Rhizobium sp. SAFR-030]